MTDTRKNIMADILYNFESLQECLGVLLREEESQARRISKRLGAHAEYESSVQTCRNLREAIRRLDGVMESAEAMGEQNAKAS